MSEISEILQNCKNGKLGEPATPEQIAEFEVRCQVRLPTEVKEFLLIANGILHNFHEIHALENWVSSDKHEDEPLLADYLDRQKYYIVGTYDISVWWWLIRLDENPSDLTPVFVTYFNVDNRKMVVNQVAGSFTEFLRTYCLDYPIKLLF